jgi:hypothetical protein
LREIINAYKILTQNLKDRDLLEDFRHSVKNNSTQVKSENIYNVFIMSNYEFLLSPVVVVVGDPNGQLQSQ